MYPSFSFNASRMKTISEQCEKEYWDRRIPEIEEAIWKEALQGHFSCSFNHSIPPRVKKHFKELGFRVKNWFDYGSGCTISWY